MAKNTKPCRLCGGKRVFGKTLCFKCILKKERAKRELKLAKLKEKKRVKRDKKLNSYRRLNKIAWELTSEAVRKSYADENGMVKCYTCPKIMKWKEADCGHFHHGKLDFDRERNLRPQCYYCNRMKHGNHAIFGTYLAQELGAEGMKKLLLDANTKIYTWTELKSIIEKLKKVED